jgi:hypothetical protein
MPEIGKVKPRRGQTVGVGRDVDGEVYLIDAGLFLLTKSVWASKLSTIQKLSLLPRRI